MYMIQSKLRLLSLPIFFFNIVISTFSVLYISEINFIDNEYMELYSNETLNLSDFNIYDDNGFEKHNSLELLSQKNSSFILIAGSNFYETYDYSKLNCTLYKTSGTQLSNGGLKSQGEGINLSNNNTNFFWKKIKDYEFIQNTSLHFHNNSEFISNQSICSLSKVLVNQDNVIIQNQTNNTDISQISSCNNSFSISIKQREITQKAEFDFIIENKDNFSIQYWVEDYEGNSIKNKIITQNVNTKSYTPIKTSPLLIKAEMFQKNCSYIDEKEFFFL